MSTMPAWLPSMPGRSRPIDWRPLDAISPPPTTGRADCIPRAGMPGVSSLGLEIGDLPVRTFLPGVENVAVLLLAIDHIALIGNIAFGVEGDIAEHRVERLAGMHDLGDFLRIGRLRLLRGLLDDLDRGVAIKRIGLRFETALLSEEVDDLLVLRVGARIGREGHQRAFRTRSGDR